MVSSTLIYNIKVDYSDDRMFFLSRLVCDTSDLWSVPYELELSVFGSQYISICVLDTLDVSSSVALWEFA